MGVFGDSQRDFAKAKIATFPVDGATKKPKVRNWQSAGLRASSEWRAKHADAAAIGFTCGPRNGLSVVDIDLPGENFLADVLAKTGPTPIVIRTASGKHHAWYRHDGEGRIIRAPGFSGPVDILGHGYAIAPPSRAAGGEYRFLCGSLADVDRLPHIAAQALPALRQTSTAKSQQAPDLVPVGRRNDALFRACLAQARQCENEDQLLNFAKDHNRAEFVEVLPSDEVARTVRSAWEKTQTGSNWVGMGPRLTIEHAEIDDLMQRDPDAFILLIRLRKEHAGLRQEFVVANHMHVGMPGGGWRRQRFTAARKRLVAEGYLEIVRPSHLTAAAVYRFKGVHF